jgi:hypothetical protein
LKQELFKSIMKQDIAFFDRQKTGELVNRYIKHFSYTVCVFACAYLLLSLLLLHKDNNAVKPSAGHGALDQLDPGLAGS